MGIGDNFDTSSGGLVNQKTGRYSGKVAGASFYEDGYHEQNILNYFYNGGHPCNVGCGCHDVCDEFATASSEPMPCYLPEELLISVVQDKQGRWAARAVISDKEAKGRQGIGGAGTVYDEAQDKDTFFLRYHNGSWRGRKCCKPNKADAQSKISSGCGPCDVTTVGDLQHFDTDTWNENNGDCLFLPTMTVLEEFTTRTECEEFRKEMREFDKEMHTVGQVCSFFLGIIPLGRGSQATQRVINGVKTAVSVAEQVYDFTLCLHAWDTFFGGSG